MSGKGSSSNGNSNSSGGSSSSAAGSSSGSGSHSSEPTIVTGWEHSTYANNNTSYAQERYAYIGKDEDSGEPQYIDYGPKGGR